MGRWTVDAEEPELPFPPHEAVATATTVTATAVADCRLGSSVFATFDCCPMCGGEMAPEHAHYRCSGCGWRDSCCD